MPQSPVVVVFENDVHCAVDGYAAIVALREQQKAYTPYVTTVSCGDFVQGDIVRAITEGEAVTDIMNLAGYDFVALGNHEFDYGMQQHSLLMEQLDATVLCANFINLQTAEPVYSPYEIVKYGNVEVAYIGVATPATETAVSYKTFLDEQGNPKYSFCNDNFYTIVQQNADKARAEGADYVVVLSHLGDEPYNDYPTSLSLISNTVGIDAVLDGHSHSVIPDSTVLNKEGIPVLLASTGTKFQHIGLLTLSTDGKFTSRLVPAADVQPDASLLQYIVQVEERVLAEGERVIGKSEVTLPVYDEQGNRFVRFQETAIGNFCADAFRIMLDTDIAMINGGGIRNDIPQGSVTFNTMYSVFPFNNTVCTASLTGAQLADALEVSVMCLTEEDGGFMQVSGVRFKVNTAIATPVVLDENNIFSHVGGGERRVSGIEILNKSTGEYIPLDNARTYTISGVNYNITELGSNGIFRYAQVVLDNICQDVEVLVNYLQQHLGGVIGSRYSTAEGRIVIY